jgi:hypothetical protein
MFLRCVKTAQHALERELRSAIPPVAVTGSSSVHQSNAHLQGGENSIYTLGYSNIGAMVGIRQALVPPFIAAGRACSAGESGHRHA